MNYTGRGNGSDGVLTVSGDTTDSLSASSISIAAGVDNATIDAGLSWAAGDLIYLHQSQGSGKNKKETLQVLTYDNGTGDITFTTPADNTYSTSGANRAQAIRRKQYSAIVFSSNANLFIQAWNTSTGIGGLFPHLVLGKITGAGTINGKGRGFIGGYGGTHYGNNQTGQQGESSTGVGGQTTSRNGSGGGGGGIRQTGEQGHGGGGGAGDDNGSNGALNVSGPNSGSAGEGGTQEGDDDLLELPIGAAGGGGGHGDTAGSDGHGNGGDGGASFDINAEDVDDTVLADLRGDDGAGTSAGNADQAGGGGGASGNGLLNGKTVEVGSWQSQATAGGTANVSANGGAGSKGRFVINACEISFNGSNPTAFENEGGHEWCTFGGSIY